MKQLSIAKAQGYRIDGPYNSYMLITRVDPYLKAVMWEGLGALLNNDGSLWKTDPCAGFLRWDELPKHGIEIVPTLDEAAMIERGRLTHKVAEDAAALAKSIDAWLSSESAR